MAKYVLNLQIESKQNVKLKQKHIERIESFLNTQFLDATFKLEDQTPELKVVEGKLETNAITATLSEWEQQTLLELLNATEPVQKTEPTDRVKMHRLRAKLPKKYLIQNRRKGGYTLVKI